MEPSGRLPAHESLSISTVVAGRRTVVEVAGEVDVDAIPMLRASLAFAANRAHRRVVIDLSGVTFMSGVGLFELVRAAESLEREGCRIELHRPSPPVAKLLEWTGGAPIGRHGSTG